MTDAPLSPERQELLRRMRAKRRAAEAARLSFAQERFWFLEQLQPGTAEYHITVATRARGKLRFDALRAALAALTDLHPGLRTRFPADNGTPRVEVLATHPAPLDVRADAPHDTPPALALEALTRAVHRAPFDLAAAPPWRIVVQRLGPDDHGIVFAFHHIIADGWSLARLARELTAAYEQAVRGEPIALPRPQTTYQELAVLERKELEGRAQGERAAALVEGWRARLAGAPSETPLPTDRPLPPIADSAGATRRFALDAQTSARIQSAASHASATPYQVLLTLVGAFLARLADADDVVVGTSYAGRDRVGSTEVFGAFVNTLPVRLQLERKANFAGALEVTRAALRDAIAAGRLPFEKLVRELAPERDPRRTPLFNVFFDLVVPPTVPPWPDVDVQDFPVDLGTTAFDLSLAIDPRGERFEVLWQYRTALFDARTIDRLGELFERFVREWLAAPELAAHAVAWLAPGELDALERAATGTRVEGAPVPNVSRYLAVADTAPGAPAIEDGPRHLTHGEVAHAARVLAARLERTLGGAAGSLGVEVERAVLVELPRSAEAVVALLATHLAAAAYVPLDVDAPAARRATLVAAFDDVRTVHLVSAADARAGTLTVDLDALLAAPLPQAAPAPALEAPSHVLFTSGSTGAPKGVVVSQRALANHGAWQRATFGFTPDDRFLLRTPLAFDASFWELWAALLAGATLVVAHAEDELAAARDARITVLQTVPSVLRSWVQDPKWKALTELRQVISGGEALALESARAAFAGHDALVLWNLYGPTEACIDASAFRGTRADFAALEGAVPIGAPLPNTRAVVVDAHGQPAPRGVAGELWLAGAQLAEGYFSNAAETARAFVRAAVLGSEERWYRTGDKVKLDHAGRLVHLGRLDDQVQVRGVRVELGEVEQALLACAGVRAAGVVALASDGSQRLVGFCELEAGVTTEAVLAELRERLPRALLPTPLVAAQALPLGPTEKLDRRALAARAAALGEAAPAPAGRAAQGPVETFLATTLGAALGAPFDTQAPPVDVDFFQLGGHSLLATRLLAAARREFDVELSLRAFFEAPTLAALAASIGRAGRGTALTPRPKEARLVPTRAQERLWLACQRAPGAQYNMPGALWFEGALDRPALLAALRAIIARHEVLRARFPTDASGRPLLVFEEPGCVQPEVVEAAGQDPAARVRAELEREATRHFDLAAGPLLVLRLLAFGPTRHALVFNQHHLIGDGWSLGVFTAELAAQYAGEPLAPLTISFGDHAYHARRTPVAGELLEDWVGRLRDAPALTAPPALPRDRFGGEQQDAERPGGELVRAIPADLTRAVREAARAARASEHNVWLTTFAAFVARLVRTDDLVLGGVAHGRPTPELQALLGFFVSALPLRVQLEERAHFGDVLDAVKASADVLQIASERLDAPGFDDLVAALHGHGEGQGEGLPLFHVAFDHAVDGQDEALVLERGSDRVAVRTEPFHGGTAKLEWNVRVECGSSGDRVRFEHDATRASGALIEVLTDAWLDFARRWLAAPETSWREVALLAGEARERVLAQGRGAHLAEAPETWVAAVRAVAARQPDAVALSSDGGNDVAFGELVRVAEALARELPTGPGGLHSIAVDVPRSPAQVALLLAINLAGRAWSCVDRQGQHVGQLDALRAAWVVRADEAPSWPPQLSDFTWTRRELGGPGRAFDEPLAYITSTSGTTGAPKAIAMPARGLGHQVGGALAAYGLGPRDVVLHRIPLTFDAALLELAAPLAAGARVVLASEKVARDPRAVVELCARAGVTTVVGVAGILERWTAEASWPPPTLRCVITGGEAPSASLVRALTALPEVRVWNSYGPAEACVEITAGELGPGDAGAPPIGRPLPGAVAHVVDPDGALVPAGIEGELRVGRPGLGRYLTDVDAQRFGPNPFDGPGEPPVLYATGDRVWRGVDGRLTFAGRVDREVKLGGRRVDLFGIEQLLVGLTEVRAAAVTHAGGQLTAHLVFDAPELPTVARLRAQLRGSLPTGAWPARWFAHAELPALSSGKVDLAALAEPADLAGATELLDAQAAPRTPLERALTEAFGRALEGAPVDRDTHFFEAGGQSLTALELVEDLREDAATREVQLADVFAAPTPARLAARLARGKAPEGGHAATWEAMQVDALLPAHWAPAARRTDAKDVVLLTGATGFLGAFLLARLLAGTERRVVCLVRAEDADTGRARVADNLARYGLELDPEASFDVLAGDLAAPRFGLDERTLARLEDEVTLVLHNGAAVDFFKDYDALRATNVEGTRAALELACAAGAGLALVSTIGVPALATGAGDVSELTPIDDLVRLEDGYEQTKWVAEALTLGAAERGLDVRIFRPGRIAAARAVATGAAPSGDFAQRFWRGCLALGVVPALDGAFDLVPVDDVAAAIVELLPTGPVTTNRVVHLVNPVPTPFDALLAAARRAVPELRTLPAPEWLALARSARGSSPLPAIAELAPLLAMLEGDGLAALDPDAALAHVASTASARLLADHGVAFEPAGVAYLDALFATLAATVVGR